MTLWLPLGIAGLLAVVYGFTLSRSPPSPAKLLLKISGMVILTVAAAWAGAPPLLVAGLAACTLGDAFLAGRTERWLIPGMAAFFIGHVFYVGLFWSAGQVSGDLMNYLARGVLVFAGAGYVFWLSPSLGPLRLPVLAYAAVILVMGAGAIALPPGFGLVLIGALMFIASDAILANELFRRPTGETPRWLASISLWNLYFFGQMLIALGFLAK
ncbi:lysoplasmalogenase family protein [Hyphomonas sp.]|uniref:lysoplasmalogenase n=1 Tax=Hyphomonas sp. TaxID=87 RepID=UPI001BCC063B